MDVHFKCGLLLLTTFAYTMTLPNLAYQTSEHTKHLNEQIRIFKSIHGENKNHTKIKTKNVRTQNGSKVLKNVTKDNNHTKFKLNVTTQKNLEELKYKTNGNNQKLKVTMDIQQIVNQSKKEDLRKQIYSNAQYQYPQMQSQMSYVPQRQNMQILKQGNLRQTNLQSNVLRNQVQKYPQHLPAEGPNYNQNNQSPKQFQNQPNTYPNQNIRTQWQQFHPNPLPMQNNLYRQHQGVLMQNQGRTIKIPNSKQQTRGKMLGRTQFNNHVTLSLKRGALRQENRTKKRRSTTWNEWIPPHLVTFDYYDDGTNKTTKNTTVTVEGQTSEGSTYMASHDPSDPKYGFDPAVSIPPAPPEVTLIPTTTKWRRTQRVLRTLDDTCDYEIEYCMEAYNTAQACGRTTNHKYHTFKNVCEMEYTNCKDGYETYTLVHMGHCFDPGLAPKYSFSTYVYNEDLWLNHFYVSPQLEVIE